MKIKMVLAVAKDGAMGRASGIPWRSKADMKHFKAETLGCAVLFGRTTWEGLPFKPLPGRLNIVITSDPDYVPVGGHQQQLPDVRTVTSLSQAVDLARDSGFDLCICGGAKLYESAIETNLVDEVVMTVVDAEVPDADAFYVMDTSAWCLTETFHLPTLEGEPKCHVVRLSSMPSKFAKTLLRSSRGTRPGCINDGEIERVAIAHGINTR